MNFKTTQQLAREKFHAQLPPDHRKENSGEIMAAIEGSFDATHMGVLRKTTFILLARRLSSMTVESTWASSLTDSPRWPAGFTVDGLEVLDVRHLSSCVSWA